MIDREWLAEPMTGDGCRAQLFSDRNREPLRAICAEDGEIWEIYANNFGPDGFDESIDRYVANPNARTFVLFDGDELAGMSSFLGIDDGRQVLEIGGTYYRPRFRGTGFNRRAKDMMLSRAFNCGIRRVEFRVDARNKRSQAAMTKLGAVREGVLRADRITWTGHVRDTVLFSILRDEYKPDMFVVAERQAPILRLRIQNPPANLLSLEVMASLQAELDSAASDDAIRVIVIAAAGKLFSAGHDLKQMSAHRSDADGGESFFTETFAVCARLMQTIVNLPKPIIAEVDGIATAAGCQLVASCDLAVASERSRFGVNGIDVGLFCSTPAVALTRNVGRKHAMHMLLTGEMIDAATAEKFGLVNRVVPQESLSQVVDDYARIIADKSPSAIALGKAAVAQQSGMSLAEAYEHTSRIMVQNMLAADANEGISAFLEKRQQRTVPPGPVEA